MADWDPIQYRRFSNERFAPFDDLVALVRSRPGLRAVDLGCGTGELTARLADRLPECEILGLDTSEAMLAKAHAHQGPRLRFERGAIEALTGSYDLIFSNAAFQWCSGHRELVARLYGLLEPGGQLVAQFPAARRPTPYGLIRELAGEEPARSALAGWTLSWEVLELEEYARILFDLGATEIGALERVYPHVLADADALVDWQLGTVLVPYRERLGVEGFAAFERTLRERTRERWPERPVFFPFRRAFIAATRPA